MMKTNMIIGWLLYICFTSACMKDEDPIVKEANSVPWQRIQGQIAYSGFEDLFNIIDGGSKEIIKVNKKYGGIISDITWAREASTLTYAKEVVHGWNGFDIQIYNLNVETGSESILFSSSYDNECPSWSKDGRLAYLNDYFVFEGQVWHYNLFINGNPLQTALGNRFFKTRPAWSPDALSIVASIYDQSSEAALYIFNLKDNSKKNIREGNGFNSDGRSHKIFFEPIYSPDGNTIAFVEDPHYLEEWTTEIWTIQPDGSNPRKLTSGFSDTQPCWSPDGKKIAFIRNQNIYLMNSDGSQVEQVTHLGKIQYICWKP